MTASRTIQLGAFAEGRNQGLEEAAQLLDMAAEQIAPVGARVNQNDLHTFGTLQRKAQAIRARKSRGQP